MNKYTYNSIISAVDFCHLIFGYLALFAMCLVGYGLLLLNIGIISMLLTAIVSVAYKVYYAIRYTDIKSYFKRRKN